MNSAHRLCKLPAKFFKLILCQLNLSMGNTFIAHEFVIDFFSVWSRKLGFVHFRHSSIAATVRKPLEICYHSSVCRVAAINSHLIYSICHNDKIIIKVWQSKDVKYWDWNCRGLCYTLLRPIDCLPVCYSENWSACVYEMIVYHCLEIEINRGHKVFMEAIGIV